jgi:hypothetical protein
MEKVDQVGMKSDRKARTALARIDNDQYKGMISAARKGIFQQNFDVNSAHVEHLLKPTSLVAIIVSD